MAFKRTWKQVQQQATVALKAHRKALDGKQINEHDADRSMALAQELIVEAAGMDKRAKGVAWQGDKNH